MTTPKRKRTERTALPATLAMTAPAVRVVIVHGWVEPGGDVWEAHYRVYPVLAILAKQQFNYSRPFNEHNLWRRAATHQEMEDAGWHFDGSTPTNVEFDYLIDDDDYGLCEASFALNTTNSTYKVVVCSWPSDEDDVRLEFVIAEVRADARALALRNKTPEPTTR